VSKDQSILKNWITNNTNSFGVFGILTATSFILHSDFNNSKISFILSFYLMSIAVFVWFCQYKLTWADMLSKKNSAVLIESLVLKLALYGLNIFLILFIFITYYPLSVSMLSISVVLLGISVCYNLIKSQDRKWKKVVFAILFICILLGLIINQFVEYEITNVIVKKILFIDTIYEPK